MSRLSIATFITFTLLFVSSFISQSEAGVLIPNGQDQRFKYGYNTETEKREELSAFP